MVQRQWMKVTGLAALFAGALVAALAFLPIDELMLPAWENDIKDWRTYLLSPRAGQQRKDIAIVLISEDSLSRYPYRSPVDRGLQAALIRDLAQAGVKAIGLDFIYDRATWQSKDDVLLTAIKGLSVPIVLGGLDQRAVGEAQWARDYQARFLRDADAPVGHLFFGEIGGRIAIGDSVIRHAAPDGRAGSGSNSPVPIAGTRSVTGGRSESRSISKSFARVLAELDGPKPLLSNSRIAWLHPPEDDSSELFATFTIPAHDPIETSSRDGDGLDRAGSDRTGILQKLPRVLPEAWTTALKDKVVLVGGNLYSTDQHLTPFSVSDRRKVPGVAIHAQLLAQLLDGRAIGELSTPVKLAAVGLLAFVGFLLGWRLEMKRYEIPIAILGTVLIIALGAFVYWSAQFIIPSSIFTAWLAGGTAGHLARGLVPLHPDGANHKEVTT